MKILQTYFIISIILFPAICKAGNSIIINEIMYNLPGADSGREWVEIFNASTTEIDITGWKFNNKSNHILNKPPKNGGKGSMKIPGNSYAVLSSNALTFMSEHPNFSGTLIDTSMSLNNKSGELKLINKHGEIINSISYNKSLGANGDGKTLELINNVLQPSKNKGGTPGAPNSAPNSASHSSNQTPIKQAEDNKHITTTVNQNTQSKQSQQLIINTATNITGIVGNPITFDASQSQGSKSYYWNFGDGTTSAQQICKHIYNYPGEYLAILKISNGKQEQSQTIHIRIFSNSIIISEFMPNSKNQWIELHNTSKNPINISGWSLKSNIKQTGFEFPQNSFINAKQFLVLESRTTKISLSNPNGDLYLLYPDKEIAQHITYTNAKPNFSINKIQNQYIWSSRPSPGSENIVSSLEQTKAISSPKQNGQQAQNPKFEYYSFTAQQRQEQKQRQTLLKHKTFAINDSYKTLPPIKLQHKTNYYPFIIITSGLMLIAIVFLGKILL